MGEIPSELLRFRDTVGPSIDKMNGAASKFASAFNDLLSANESAKKGVDSYYVSDKKADVIDAFAAINNKCAAIENALSGDVINIINDSKTLSYKVTQLENINKELKDLQTKLNNNTDPAIKESVRREINTKTDGFNRYLNEAKDLYRKLKSYAGSLQASASDDLGKKITAKLTGRSFEIEEFVVNGQKMRCYVYRPIYDGDVKLPVMEFMYGLGFDNVGDGMAVNNSLGKLINEGVVLPDDAIVAIPIVQNGWQYEQPWFRDMLAQLPLEVAKKYNGDTDRLSLGGTSYGAVTAYRLVNENPGRFSAIMAVYGAGDVTEAFKGMKVVNYTGRGGGNHTELNYIKRQTEELKKYAAEVSLVTYDDTWNHSNTGTRAFSEKKANGEFVVEDVFRWSKKNITQKDQTNTVKA